MSKETPEYNYNEDAKPENGQVSKDFDSLGKFDDSGNRGKRELKRAPLGPDSLLWQWGADNRIHLLRGYTGVLQNMHPAIGQSLLDHSKFFEEPFSRLERSTPQIIYSIYDDGTRAKQVRDYHHGIKGTLRDGTRYHSLNPDVYWWAHATFVWRVIWAQELFGTPFTREEKEQIIQEGVTWWDMYGMSERPVIDTLEGYEQYFKEMEDNVLERNETVDFALRTARVEPVKAPDGVPEAVWKVIWKPIMNSLIWLTYGTLNDKQREILDLEWTAKDQKRFDRIADAVRKLFEILPEDKRYMEPGRSMMIKAGMIDGEYKEPKLAAPYGHGEEAPAEAAAKDKTHTKDAKAGKSGLSTGAKAAIAAGAAVAVRQLLKGRKK
ncbi:DUF2236 domain-containing protein [Corynebacterium aquatimens]|uniref:oxygenase MpaB family protein n=1 Tax=Corynebacterium TaxID=1716 RepID=UPI001F3B67CA|nr:MULTISPECIES: oxygenase MpaB family protein [Corynebacterium]QYH19584.1 DUF2236 domain-containing protein [Corynebacterium aquatimens]UIZ91446.1 DUF2236 domain-containing protein [Corynebacterium sp. CNCTC7651]